jgi:large subunit ribosomal protein L24
VPGYVQKQYDFKAPFHAMSIPIRTEDVRLVVPLRDDTTGEIKDIIVEHLQGGEPITEQEYGSSTPEHSRYITGSTIRIPWPRGDIQEKKAEAADTLRVHVDDRTFSPSLGYMPIPETVIDEMRPKYGKGRTVHTQEYIQQKMKEDAEELWKKRKRVLSPQQEYWEHKAKLKEAQGKPEVTEETLDIIRDMQATSLGGRKQAVGGVAS